MKQKKFSRKTTTIAAGQKVAQRIPSRRKKVIQGNMECKGIRAPEIGNPYSKYSNSPPAMSYSFNSERLVTEAYIQLPGLKEDVSAGQRF